MMKRYWRAPGVQQYHVRTLVFQNEVKYSENAFEAFNFKVKLLTCYMFKFKYSNKQKNLTVNEFLHFFLQFDFLFQFYFFKSLR